MNARAARGQTALMWAAAQRHPEVVKVLLSKGADVHSRSEVWSQMMAVPPHGVPLYNKVIPQGGDTALLFAARSGDLASATHLVAAGANVNDADAWGVSATVLAAHSGFGDLVEFLLERGADPNAAARRVHGAPCRHHAPRTLAMASALLGHGADPNAPVKTWTPTGARRRTTTSRPNSSAPRPSGSRPGSARPMSCGCSSKHGADAQVVHTGHYHAEEPVEPRSQVTTR